MAQPVEYETKWLSLPKLPGFHRGADYEGNLEAEGEILWNLYKDEAEVLGQGVHDLTPPTLRDSMQVNLQVDVSTAIEKAKFSGGIRFIEQPHFQSMVKQTGLVIIRFPLDLKVHYGAYALGGGAPRIFYIVKHLLKSPLEIDPYQREAAEARGRSLNENRLRQIIGGPRVPVGV